MCNAHILGPEGSSLLNIVLLSFALQTCSANLNCNVANQHNDTFLSSDGVNDNDNDTQKKSAQQSSEAWPYRRECRSHNTAKTSLSERVRLALLARFALENSKMTVCSTSGLEKKK